MSRRAARPRGRLHVVLLAGGSGTRFWPLSRTHRPKQLLALAGSEPLIGQSWKRMRRVVPRERLWVIAPRRLAAAVRRALPALLPRNLVLEPSARDTGPAVALACAAVSRRDPAAVIGLFPTDQIVRDSGAFGRAIGTAVEEARAGALVCLGVRPDRPATGFGYLECPTRPRGSRAVAVRRFVEKPDLARAKRFLRSGRYLWNAGMFVWRAERFLAELERTEPAILHAVAGHLAGRSGAWASAPRRSVDYAVMERARGVRVVPLDAGWDDVGSWDAAARLREEAGRSDPEQLLLDSPGSAVFAADGRLVAVVDVPGVVVVDTPEALLVVSRRSSEKVRRVVEELGRRGRTELL